MAHARCQMLPWLPRRVHSTTSSPPSGRSLRLRVPGQGRAWGSHGTAPEQSRAELPGCRGAPTDLGAGQAVPEGEAARGSAGLLVGCEELGPLPAAPRHRGVHGQEVA